MTQHDAHDQNEAILAELVSTIAITNQELRSLQEQVALQTDATNETRRHTEAVRKSVNWDNLGPYVFQGVAKTVEKQFEVSDELIETNSQIMLKFTESLPVLSKERKAMQEATQSASEAAQGLQQANGRNWRSLLTVGALSAFLAAPGGYLAALHLGDGSNQAEQITGAALPSLACEARGFSMHQLDGGSSRICFVDIP